VSIFPNSISITAFPRQSSLLKLRYDRSIIQIRLGLHPLKLPQLWPKNPPDQPITASKHQHWDANNRVQPIRKRSISFSSWGPQERRNEQETLRDEEEEGDDDPGFEGTMEIWTRVAENEKPNDNE
jgi:hypothetical protein